MLFTITASIQGKRRFTLNSVTCAVKSAFAPICRVCYILSIGVKVTHRFHARSQIRCAIYTMHGLLFKHSDVSQASEASCFTSTACLIRIHRHSFLVHMMSVTEDKHSSNSLTSYDSQPSLSSPLLISHVHVRALYACIIHVEI